MVGSAAPAPLRCGGRLGGGHPTPFLFPPALDLLCLQNGLHYSVYHSDEDGEDDDPTNIVVLAARDAHSHSYLTFVFVY